MKIFPKTLDEQLTEEGFSRASESGGTHVTANDPLLTPELLAHDVFHGLRAFSGHAARNLSMVVHRINDERKDCGYKGPAEIYIRETVERDGSKNYEIYYKTRNTRQFERKEKEYR